MTARDELLNLHRPLVEDARQQPEYHDNTVTAIHGYSEGVEHALDTAWAKGYRKPRTITTVEELDKLPVGSVVINVEGDVCERSRGGWSGIIKEPSMDSWLLTGAEAIDLPAIVLYEPTEATQ